MKRVFLLVIATIYSLLSINANNNDVVIVYRNDGIVNGFVRSQIDSIKYSKTGIDNIEYAQYVVNEIWTQDSLYRIPIEVIDSVSFVAPPTIYQDDVVPMSAELCSYIIGVNDTIILFRNDTPERILPKIGDKIVTEEIVGIVPNGFIGQVESIEKQSNCISAKCLGIDIEEVFKSYCSANSFVCRPESIAKNGMSRATIIETDTVRSLGPYKFSLDINTEIGEIKGLDKKYGYEGGLEFAPTLRIKSFTMVDENYGVSRNFSITGAAEVTESLAIYGQLDKSKDFLDTELSIPVGGFVNFYIKPGYFVKANCRIGCKAEFKQLVPITVAYEFNSHSSNNLKNVLHAKVDSTSYNIEGFIDGSFSAGLFFEMGFNIINSKLSKVCLREEGGIELSGDVLLLSDDLLDATKTTELYDNLKGRKIALNTFVSLALEAKFLKWEASMPIAKVTPNELWSMQYVPDFNKVRCERTNPVQNEFATTLNVSGKCILPVEIGLSNRRNDIELEKVSLCEYRDKLPNKEFLTTLNIPYYSVSEYKVYPTVTLFGIRMLASPPAELISEFPIKVEDYNVAYSERRPNNYGGYDYEYYCITDLTISDDIQQYDDYGYIIGGHMVSMKDCSELFQDEKNPKIYHHWNTGHSRIDTCIIDLGSYIVVNNEVYDYHKEKAEDFMFEVTHVGCPDQNHPHAIDLGLPSGTKWSCCDVGSKEPLFPEEVLFAFGETYAKDRYDYSRENYTYYESDDEGWYYEDLYDSQGKRINDISGTAYDVATVLWGAPWRMPSEADYKELFTHCKSPFLWQVPVSKGPNGKVILFPATTENYWISSNYGPYDASSFSSNKYIYSWYYSGFNGWSDRLIEYKDRAFGLKVRAICK